MAAAPSVGSANNGFVRGRNVLNTLMMSFGSMAPFVGGLAWAGLPNWSVPLSDGGPSHGAVALFQLTFAVITPALISGAVVERMAFRAWMLFVLLWSVVVYIPMAPMVWGPGGFLGTSGGLGVLDFAGGYPVEMASGIAAAVAATVVGPRRGHPSQIAPPHNVPFIVLGVGLLWFGWLGFNGGSGLVPITPAAGCVSPMAALAIGALAALVCSQALQIKGRFHLDDSLDVLPIHGLAGLLGVLLTGTLHGGPGQLWVEVGTYGVLRLVAFVEPLRVRPDEERQGLDVNAHGEEAYIDEFTG